MILTASPTRGERHDKERRRSFSEKFWLCSDQLLAGSGGESKISFEDYAITLVDELETPLLSVPKIEHFFAEALSCAFRLARA